MCDKSYVTMVRKTCVSCGKEYDVNELLIDTRLKKTFEKYTNVGIGLCEECEKETIENKGLWLIGYNEEKQHFRGAICVKEDKIREAIKDLPDAPEHIICVPEGFIETLTGMNDENRGDAKE